MTNCVCNLLRGLWSFLMGSLRMILFFGCLLFILIQSIWILMLIHASNSVYLQLPGSSIDYRDYLHAFCLLALSLLGCYGSFYKHHPSIKAFSLLTALSTAVLILMVLYTMSPEDMKKENEVFFERMHKYIADYDWSKESKSHEVGEANKAWDSLQNLLCCGIKGPSDWDKYRPYSIDDKVYPSSCCINTLVRHQPFQNDLTGSKTCTTGNGLFKDGCQLRIQQIEDLNLMFICFFIALQLLLCVIACLVGSFNLDRCTSQQATVHTASSTRAHSPQDYQRFEGSVYVRQPPINQSHQQSLAAKVSTPPLYPNIHDVEKSSYSAPPPSYGTGP